jgi:hypothetical protein
MLSFDISPWHHYRDMNNKSNPFLVDLDARRLYQEDLGLSLFSTNIQETKHGSGTTYKSSSLQVAQ